MSTTSLLWLSCCWICILMYVRMRNEGSFKKNIAIGVTLPQQAQNDPEVTRTIASFRRKELILAIFMSLVALVATWAAMQPAWADPMMCLWIVWLTVSCVAPEFIFARANLKLAAIKQAHGWYPKRVSARSMVADITAAANQMPRMHGFWFWILAALSALPWAFSPSHDAGYFIYSAMVVMMWAVWRWCYRDKSEVVDDNTLRTEALGRIRRHAWAQVNLLCALCMTILSWLTLAFGDEEMLFFVSVVVLMVLMAVSSLFIEMHVRHLQAQLTQDVSGDTYVDEDAHWILGMFYHNPDDERLIINNRVGINMSVNLARPLGKAIAGTTVLIIVGVTVFVLAFFMPGNGARMNVSDGAIETHCALASHTIDLEDILSAEKIDELPTLSRRVGAATDTMLEGSFRSDELGDVTVSLNRLQGPWLLIHTRDATYLIGGQNEDAFREVTDALAAQGISIDSATTTAS